MTTDELDLPKHSQAGGLKEQAAAFKSIPSQIFDAAMLTAPPPIDAKPHTIMQEGFSSAMDALFAAQQAWLRTVHDAWLNEISQMEAEMSSLMEKINKMEAGSSGQAQLDCQLELSRSSFLKSLKRFQTACELTSAPQREAIAVLQDRLERLKIGG